jgi:hypothetical protein
LRNIALDILSINLGGMTADDDLPEKAFAVARHSPQRALTRTTAILGCRVTGCMNSHSK